MTRTDLDTMAIEARARALRSAYIREAVVALFARLRGRRAAGNAPA